MSTAIWIFSATIWLTVGLIGTYFDGVAWNDAYCDRELVDSSCTALKILLEPNLQHLFGFTVPLPNFQWWQALFAVMTWNFNIFDGSFMLMRWILLLLITFPIYITIIVLMAPTMMSALGFMRRLLPF